MRILFVHQNFPAQFKHLAPALAADSRNTVVAMTMKDYPAIPGVSTMKYAPGRSSSKDIHPWAADFETKVIRADAAFRAALELKKRGFEPDVIVAHPGWGESLFLKDVWPNARLGIYCEFFYHAAGADTGFDAEFPVDDIGFSCKLSLKNVNNILHFEKADAGLCPTYWQASTFPDYFRKKIEVIHDGIDTDSVKPNLDVAINIHGKRKLTKLDEVITFVNRNLEPYRGYHSFMRSLPEILQARPNAHVLIVGGDGVSYGASPGAGSSWKHLFLNEVSEKIDLDRVHFLGNLSYKNFISVLQISTVHVYLTYPFVLSWSLLEAMSIGCAVVASNTEPVKEVIEHGHNGLMADFFDVNGIAKSVISLLADADTRIRLGVAARQTIIDNYDLKTNVLPRQLGWVSNLYKKPLD